MKSTWEILYCVKLDLFSPYCLAPYKGYEIFRATWWRMEMKSSELGAEGDCMLQWARWETGLKWVGESWLLISALLSPSDMNVCMYINVCDIPYAKSDSENH